MSPEPVEQGDEKVTRARDVISVCIAWWQPDDPTELLSRSRQPRQQRAESDQVGKNWEFYLRTVDARARRVRSYRSRERARFPHLDLHHFREPFLLSSKKSQSHSAHRLIRRRRSDVSSSTADMTMGHNNRSTSSPSGTSLSSNPRSAATNCWRFRAARHRRESDATSVGSARRPSAIPRKSSYSSSRSFRMRLTTPSASALCSAVARRDLSAFASTIPARRPQTRRSR